VHCHRERDDVGANINCVHGDYYYQQKMSRIDDHVSIAITGLTYNMQPTTQSQHDIDSQSTNTGMRQL